MARVTFRTTSGKVVSFPTKRRNPTRRAPRRGGHRRTVKATKSPKRRRR